MQPAQHPFRFGRVEEAVMPSPGLFERDGWEVLGSQIATWRIRDGFARDDIEDLMTGERRFDAS